MAAKEESALPIGHPFEVETYGSHDPGCSVAVLRRFRAPPPLEDPECYWRTRLQDPKTAPDLSPSLPTWFNSRGVMEGPLAANSGAWALVQMYGVPRYDTSTLHEDFQFNGESSKTVASHISGLGLLPASPSQLARAIAEWERVRAFPYPRMPLIVALGRYFGPRRKVRWLGCRLGARRMPFFCFEADAEPSSSAERPYWRWQTHFLFVPPGTP